MKLSNAYIIDGDVIEKAISERENTLLNINGKIYPRFKLTIESELALLKDLKQHLKPALPIVEDIFDDARCYGKKTASERKHETFNDYIKSKDFI